MREIVWLVLAADRQVLQVCSSADHARDQAHAMDGTYESWPIEHSLSVQAWNQAIRQGLEFSRNLREVTQP